MIESRTLHSIREAEQKAAALKRHAEDEKETILSKAREEAVSILNLAEGKVGESANRIMAEAEKQIAAKRDKLRLEARSMAKDMEEDTTKQAEEATGYVFSEFSKEAAKC